MTEDEARTRAEAVASTVYSDHLIGKLASLEAVEIATRALLEYSAERETEIADLREMVRPLADSALPDRDTIAGWRIGYNIPLEARYRANEYLYGPNPHAIAIEARRAATPQSDAVTDESAGLKGIAQGPAR